MYKNVYICVLYDTHHFMQKANYTIFIANNAKNAKSQTNAKLLPHHIWKAK